MDENSKMQRRAYGSGSITKKGYIRYGSSEFQHRRVWRKHYGAVPEDSYIHHINGINKIIEYES